MRILLSLLLLFGCGEDGDADQQSEGGSSDQQSEGGSSDQQSEDGSSDQQSELDSYESIDCVDRSSRDGRYFWSVIIEGVNPAEVHIVLCGPHRDLSLSQTELDDVKACGDPTDMLYRDGSIEVYCSLQTRINFLLEPHPMTRPGDWVVYYKKL